MEQLSTHHPILQDFGASRKAEKPTKLFDFDVSDERISTFDISPDGTWFIGVQRDPTARPVEVEVVLNFLWN